MNIVEQKYTLFTKIQTIFYNFAPVHKKRVILKIKVHYEKVYG